MSIQDAIEFDVDEMFENTFSPTEFPNISKSAELVVSTRSGYQSVTTTTYPILVCLQIDYTAKEMENANLQQQDVRFMIRNKEVPVDVKPDNADLVWGGKTFNVVRVENVGGLVYDLNCRGM